MRRHTQFLDLRMSHQSSDLTSFTTDGCSGGLSIGWEYLADSIDHFQQIHGDTPPWEECCIAHDRAYHVGSSESTTPEMSFTARKHADQKLLECVYETGVTRTRQLEEVYGLSQEKVDKLYLTIAHLMYRAVRIGGMPCTGLPWRWGFGWPECH